MTPKRTKTVKVKGVAVLVAAGYLQSVHPYGEEGAFFSRLGAVEHAKTIVYARGDCRLIDCTITFQLPNRRTNTKGKK